ncbi:response regulator [Motiliproteus sediminis]|uniref:response regulator n=1 Tax=Motiliproteus sediminis TaxID=1468178 RepID=UPI001AEF523D
MTEAALKDKRVLLVDSSGNLRWTVKGLLESMGFGEVATLNISQSVLDTVADSSFDIILIGHNVHDRYSGLQLLEEARYKGLIKPTCSWVLLTSDASQESVLFAIEIQPDEVITKPFTMQTLERRLRALCKRKQAMEPIERAVERQAYNRAIKLCDSLMNKSDPNYVQAQLIKGRLLMDMGEYAQARPVFEQLHWAGHGLLPGYKLSECDFLLGDLDQAEQRLQAVIEEHPLLIPAYDLLARVYEARGQQRDAQLILVQATDQSPRSIDRQMNLGRLAVNNADLPVAERAYRRSVHLGEHSCRASSAPLLKLANVTRLQMEQGAPEERQSKLQAIEKMVAEARKRFANEPDLMVRCELLQAKVEETLGNPDAAQQCYERAQQAAQRLEGTVDLEQVKRRLLDEQPPEMPKPRVVEEKPAKSSRDPAMSDKVNRIGVRNYLADKQGQAIRYFNLAFDYNPLNGNAMLNLAQLFLEGARDIPARKEERLKMYQRYMRLAGRLPLAGPAKAKYDRLLRLGKEPVESLPPGMLAELLK